MILAAIPIKPFGVAKARLSPVLGPAQRSELGRAVAARTARLSAEAGAEVVVVTGDHGVAEWAKRGGLGVLMEDTGLADGLNGAATTAAHHASALGLPWVVVHADLPVATADDLRTVFDAAAYSPVIVPSHDAGTNLIGGAAPSFPFAYGVGSFHRHLAAIPDATVITSQRLALDLDNPRDLGLALRSATGMWLADVIDRT